jgi:hypothetical protein
MRKLGLGLLLAATMVLAPTGLRADEAEDTAFAQRIAQRLKESGRLQGYRIGVKYKDGAAWLVGTVSNQQQLEAALAIAEQTPGVDYIVNKLELATPSTIASDSGAVQPVSMQQPTPAAQFAPPPVPAAAQQIPAAVAQRGMPLPMGYTGPVQPANYGQPLPAHAPGMGGVAPAAYDSPNMPGYAWPSYAAYPNYAALTYPKQYSPSAFPYIGPFYPYPQVPLGWRKVSLEWDDGWWMLDFHERHGH